MKIVLHNKGYLFQVTIFPYILGLKLTNWTDHTNTFFKSIWIVQFNVFVWNHPNLVPAGKMTMQIVAGRLGPKCMNAQFNYYYFFNVVPVSEWFTSSPVYHHSTTYHMSSSSQSKFLTISVTNFHEVPYSGNNEMKGNFR